MWLLGPFIPVSPTVVTATQPRKLVDIQAKWWSRQTVGRASSAKWISVNQRQHWSSAPRHKHAVGSLNLAIHFLKGNMTVGYGTLLNIQFCYPFISINVTLFYHFNDQTKFTWLIFFCLLFQLVCRTWLCSFHMASISTWQLTRWNLLNRCTEMRRAFFTVLSFSHARTHASPPPKVSRSKQLPQCHVHSSWRKVQRPCPAGRWTIFKLNTYHEYQKKWRKPFFFFFFK